MTSVGWFRDELLARAIASTTWTLILQIPVLLALKLIFSGYQGIWNCFTLLLQNGSFLSFIMIPVTLCGLTAIHMKMYKVEPTIYQTRWMMLKDLFNPVFIFLLYLFGFSGGILINSYFSITAPFLGHFSNRCQTRNVQCLNEMHLFGVLFGIWIGLCEGWAYYFSEQRLVRIPHIQQHIKVAVRSNIVKLLKSSLMTCFKRYLVFMALYWTAGGNLRSYVLEYSQLALDEPLDSILGLINISLAIRCIVIGSTCVFTFRLSNLLFHWFLIKPVSFAITRAGEMNHYPLLPEALTCHIPLLQLWACRDWAILAEQSWDRRSQIFSVSQPGNHPHNWNAMFSALYPHCRQFLSALRGDAKENPVKTVDPAPMMSPQAEVITSPTRMRSMVLKSPAKVALSSGDVKLSLQDKISNRIQEKLDNFKKKPFIQYLWGELPDAKRRQAFARSETIILLIEGLSHFVTASFTEDKYGVVQKDLPEILALFLDLQAATEIRGASSGVLPKRSETLTNPPPDVLSKQKLKSTIKSSIYRLVVRFQRHITRIQLSLEHKQMLEQYLEFRVG